MSQETAAPVSPLALTQRFSREGRWHEIQPVRDLMMRECRQKGMTKEEAHAWTYSELDRLYPPLDEVTQGESCNGDSDSLISGDSSPYARAREEWPDLPDNASLVAELSWVQAQRLRIVEERPSGQPIVRLDRAGSPPPSWAALGWLDTAIRNPAKWADLCAKGLQQQDLDSDLVKRERRRIEDVRQLLAEMLPPSSQ